MKKYKLYTVMLCILLLFTVGFLRLENKNSNDKDSRFVELNNEEKIDNNNNTEQVINDDYTVSEDFTSHLPLVVIDLEGGTIPDNYKYSPESESFELEEGIDPYSKASMRIINNNNGTNSILDNEEVSSKINIRYRGNSSITYEKKQFGIKLVNDDGDEAELPIMGMEAHDDWILNISMTDPSLIRNYLALNIAGEIMEYSPNVRYCEVILKDGDSYQYQGLYLMMESIKKSEGRVNISSYQDGNKYTSYILRRDRFKKDGVMLNTTAALEEQCYGWLEVQYPPKEYIDENLYNYILNDVEKIEQIVYSDDHEKFGNYRQYIDENSFIDYFIINEFFMNYDSGTNSTYYYKNHGDKLKIGPVWDFDQAVDNDSNRLAEIKEIAFLDKPWFERLIKSDTFTKKMLNRYNELREDILSDENIEAKIDGIAAYLGDAQKRDYMRWQHQYFKVNSTPLEDENGITIYRDNLTFEEQIFKVKGTLKLHGVYMKKGLKQLIYENMGNGRTYSGLAIVFVIAFFSSIMIARRKYN